MSITCELIPPLGSMDACESVLSEVKILHSYPLHGEGSRLNNHWGSRLNDHWGSRLEDWELIRKDGRVSPGIADKRRSLAQRTQASDTDSSPIYQTVD